MTRLSLLLALGLAATSCVPSTPQTRIEQNPALFAALPAKEQELAQRGEIAKGMSSEAVLIALGPPSSRYEGFQQGKASERWDYRGAYPVYTQSFHGGYGYGHYGCYRHGYGGFGYGPQVTYIPYRKSSVWFVNNRVDAWERLR